MKLKENFNKMTIRTAMLCDSEYWAIKKKICRENESEVRLLRWMSGNTL